jgi:zinc protease
MLQHERLWVNYHKEVLSNGIVLIVAPKTDTRLVSVNLLYRTGSRDESPEMTGLAHLMEHLMFSGTQRVPAYDLPVARVGGVNNAFTNQDFTNYYLVLPANHIELAFSLEADRMSNLPLNDQHVSVQKSVVIEEFQQRYLNQPYGDLNHLLCAAAYTRHHYRWPTIGLIPQHIADATAQDVASFYRNHYHPSNLILAVAGDVNPAEVIRLADQSFGTIAAGSVSRQLIPAEDTEGRSAKVVVHRKVPSSLLTIAYPIPGADHPDYIGFGYLADILGQGIISRLHLALVKGAGIFTRISANINGTLDPGLFSITGVLVPGIDSHSAASQIQAVIDAFMDDGPAPSEMRAVTNSTITHTLYKRTNVMNLALELAVNEFEGEASKINSVLYECERMSPELLISLAATYLKASNRVEVHYLKE